jgi:micrococcal nuclease
MLKRALIFIGIIILLGLLSVYYPDSNDKQEYEKEPCFVNRIIDGDTLVCNNETIRLLGIDTPEKGEEGYQEATDFLKQVENKEIEILRDWENLGKYKRKLRYVFYEDRLINIEILELGLGRAFIIEDLKYENKIIIAENFAKDNCLGVWEGEC